MVLIVCLCKASILLSIESNCALEASSKLIFLNSPLNSSAFLATSLTSFSSDLSGFLPTKKLDNALAIAAPIAKPIAVPTGPPSAVPIPPNALVPNPTDNPAAAFVATVPASSEPTPFANPTPPSIEPNPVSVALTPPTDFTKRSNPSIILVIPSATLLNVPSSTNVITNDSQAALVLSIEACIESI